MVDEKRVRKIYKLNVAGGGGGGGKKAGGNGEVNGNVIGIGKGDEEVRKELLVGVLGAMALRSVTN